MSHYYLNDQTLESKQKSFKINLFGLDFIFFTDLGVFSKERIDFGSKLLIKNLNFENKKQTIIDMGSGYGPIGIYAAKKFDKSTIHMFDVNQRAIDLAHKNIEENNIKNASALVSNLFEKVHFTADVILTNPPIRAGKDIIFKLYEGAYLSLNQGGLLYVVINKKQGAPSSLEKIKEIFGNCEMIDRDKGYWILLAKKN